MSDHDLDRQIDLVARQMTAVPEDGSFRARVTAQLGPARQRPRLGWTWVRAGAWTTTVAALAMAAYVAWHRPPIGVHPSSTSADVARDSSAGHSGVGVTPAMTAPTNADSSRLAVARRERVLVESSVPRLPALETPALPPLAVIQPDPLNTPLLVVTPIATEPLVLAPIDGGKD